MAYDIELTPKVVDSEDLDSLEKRIHEIEEHGIEIKTKDDEGFLKIEKKIKEIEDEGLKLKFNFVATNKETAEDITNNVSAISKLIQQLNTLAGFDEKQLNKKVDLTVNVKNLTKEITEGLAILNKLNPNISIDTTKIESTFKQLMDEYDSLYDQYEGLFKGDNASMGAIEQYVTGESKNLKEIISNFTEAQKVGQRYLAVVQRINDLASKDPSLVERLSGGFLPDVSETIKDSREIFIKGFKESYHAVAQEYKKLISNDKELLSSGVGSQNEINKRIEKNKQALKELGQTYASAIKSLSGKLEDSQLNKLLGRLENPKGNNLDEIAKQAKSIRDTNKKEEESFDNLGDQTQSFIERFQEAITKLHTEMSDLNTEYIGPMATNIKKLKTILDEMNQAVQQIKSPFDETSISNTATRLEELFKQYNSLDGTEKEMKIGVEISSEDEQKLKNVAKYADEIKSVMRNITTYKAIGSGQDSQGNNKSSKKKEQKESTDSQSGVANKESKKAVAETNKAVEAYDKLVPKEVKITLNVENLNDLETAVSHIKELDQRNENIAQDAVTSVKPKIQSGVSKPSNAKGNITPNNGSSRNNAPTDPDVSAKLQNILTTEDQIVDGLKDVDDKLKSILNIIPSSEKISSIVDKVVNKLEELKTPLATQNSLSNNTSITNDSSDSFKDEDDAYILQHPDGFEKVFHTLQEAYKWIARADLSQVSNAFITKGKIKDGNFDEDDVIEKVTEERLHEILTQFGNVQSQAYEIFRSALSKFEQPLQNLTDKIDNLQSYYDQTDKNNLKSIDQNIWTITNLIQIIKGSFTSPKNPNSNNESGQGYDNNVLGSIGDNIKHSVDLMSQAVDEFSSLLNRFSRRFPIQQNNNSGVSQPSADGDSGKQSLISTLIDPKLSAIQTAVTNIDNKIANTETSQKKADKNVAPPASVDVQNINKNVANILSSLKSIGDKVAGKSKKSETSGGTKGGTKSKDNTSVIKDKLNNLPTKLNSLQQTNSSISKNTKAIQTNTGKISTKVGTINDTIKSKAGEISAQLSSIDNHVSQGNTPASPNAATKNDYTNLETAIKALTQTLSTPTATGSAQNAQNNATAPSTAQAAANLANASSLQTQATNRIKELQTVLGFMNGGSFSSIFGSTQDIESYIVSLETLNKEIASAGKMLNRNDISAAQRSNTEQKLSANTAILNGYINGDDSLGINATQIANINALLQAMTTINSRITGADAAFEGLTKLKETLKSYDITVQPLQAAIDNLKATRENLKQMSDKISSSSLTEQEFANLQTAITSAETSYQEAINKSNELLNTNQKDSLQSITSEFNQAQQEVTKYSAKIEKLKNFLRDLKAKKIDLSTINMGNGRTAKDMETFLADYEKAIALKHNFNSTQEMQTYAANFVANYQTPLKQYVDGLGEANRQFKNMTQAASESIRHNNFGKQLADFTTSVKKWGDTNSGVFSRAEFKDRYNKIMTELTSGSVQSADQLARLRSEFANLKLAANQAGVATKSFTAKLKEMYKKYGGWTLVTKTLNTAMRLLRSMVTQVKEVDTAMTNLKKVTEATGNQLNTFLESAGKRSVALGASLTDYVDAVSEFSRLGKSLDEAQKLGELATTYKTVAEDLDIKTASKSIISTMQAFNSVGVQADEIVDKFNYVGKMLPLITISVKVRRRIRPR